MGEDIDPASQERIMMLASVPCDNWLEEQLRRMSIRLARLVGSANMGIWYRIACWLSFIPAEVRCWLYGHKHTVINRGCVPQHICYVCGEETSYG